MALIEGVGDEVVAAFVVTLLISLLYLSFAELDFYSLLNLTGPLPSPVGESQEVPVTSSENESPLETTESNESRENEPEPMSGAQEAAGDSIPPLEPNIISIRLKFLNDTERTVTCDTNKTVIDFKRGEFTSELESNKRVKLIYNGRLLHDTELMSSYQVCEQCVIHVQICQNQPPTAGTTLVEIGIELDLNNYLWPLIALGLVALWVIRFKFKDHFDGVSTAILVSLSFFFISFILGNRYRRPLRP